MLVSASAYPLLLFYFSSLFRFSSLSLLLLFSSALLVLSFANTVNFLKSNGDSIEQYASSMLEEVGSGGIAEYISRMRMESEYGDELTLMVLGQLYQLRIHIISNFITNARDRVCEPFFHDPQVILHEIWLVHFFQTTLHYLGCYPQHCEMPAWSDERFTPQSPVCA